MCINSREELQCLEESTGRCLTSLSQRIAKKNSTETREITEPVLASTFQAIYVSG